MAEKPFVPVTNPSSFAFIVLTPAGTPDARLAIAASRAGATGVLNLEFTKDRPKALRAMNALGAHAGGSFGVMVDAAASSLLRAVLQTSPQGFGTVILTNPAGVPLEPAISASRKAGKRVLVVTTSLTQALGAAGQPVDGLIAKGNEAGGWVGEETAFVLLQRLLPAVTVPVYVQGGIGMHTAAACMAAGAAGIVLDNQLLLTRESPLRGKIRSRVETMDGSETQSVGSSLGAPFRAYSRGDSAMIDILSQMEAAELLAHDDLDQARESWRASLNRSVDWEREGALWPAGQDAAFASDFAKRYVTVGGVLTAMRASVAEHCSLARQQLALAADAPLARSHGTRYPIVQGPMTRVSDRAQFAGAVGDAGGLPFLALALMRAEEIRPLLKETAEMMAGRPWGVGILGFVPPGLRDEQLQVVREALPPFALIAGGQPHQARALEAEGIETYLHVPSPGLLEIYLQEGARRFVFEGRECGGHVGPRTSFVLWEGMIDVLLEFKKRSRSKDEFNVLFAGGVHDGLSAQMVAAMAATAVAQGISIGVLLGTAYLFTEEAVSSGAIQEAFQKAAVDCTETVILSATPGYATRCLPSPFCETFETERRRLILQGTPLEEMKQGLEELNIGRLRIASKGVDRNPQYGTEQGAPRLIGVDPEDQWQQGMYMIGQVASLRNRTVTVADLHSEVSDGSTRRLEMMRDAGEADSFLRPRVDIAIVGMSSILPGSSDLEQFWANVLNKVDAIREIPADRWDWREYYDPDPNAEDKVYSKWGGFIDEVAFDPLQWGMPPSSLASIEPFQLLALELVRSAVEDAGYTSRPFPRERTSVILGAGGGAPDLTAGYVVRSSLAGLFGSDMSAELARSLEGTLPHWTEDSFPGLLMNVAAGRVANRFDFGGINYTVDAACASSLAAVYLGIRDLQARTSDVVIVGGAEGIQNPFDFLCFAKTHALSPTGRSRPFDADADGIAISEGFASLFLKRLEDAERDGDRIYAVIRGAGASSDGRDKGLTAPRPEGQMRAFRRAYQEAGFSPATVGLFEAHGTGTVAGDQAEISSMTTLLAEAGAQPGSAAIGSVKSMIGHTKATAGVAGLVKTAKALHHRILPPTQGVVTPNPKLQLPDCPLYVNSEARPWVQAEGGDPRRAAVSAFGFGGTNFHVVLEEYAGDYLHLEDPAVCQWPDELFLWRAPSTQELIASVDELTGTLEAGARPRLSDLAFTLSAATDRASEAGPALAVVAGTPEVLLARLQEARRLLAGGEARTHQAQGIHLSTRPLAPGGRLAFLFPGQGSQEVNMAGDLAMMFTGVRAALDEADEFLAGHLDRPLSRYIYPPPAFSAETEKAHSAALTKTNIAQPALGAAEVAMLALLEELAIRPDMTAGHSYGEFVALHAAGSIDFKTLMLLSEARGRFMAEAAEGTSGGMVAILAGPQALEPLLEDPELTLANLNSPAQTVLSGTSEAVNRSVEWCSQHGLKARRLPVASAFHSPLVASAQQRLASVLEKMPLNQAMLPVFSNTTGVRYPKSVREISALLAGQLARPVRFVDEVEAMYEDGARIFLEVGPRNVLTGLVRQTLGERPHIAVPLDLPGRSGLNSLLNALAALFVEGVSLCTDRLYSGRGARQLDLKRLHHEEPQLSPTTWMVSGAGVRPAGAPRARADLPVAISLNGQNHLPIAPPSPPQAPATQERPAAGATPRLSNPPAAAPLVDRPGESVTDHFQRVMQRFLQVQENFMISALAGPPGPTPEEPLEPELVVSAHPVPEVLPGPGAPEAEPAAPTSTMDREMIGARLLSIVSERTGYPVETISLDADLEADLGVDSIKRVEIAGAINAVVAGSLGQSVELERLTGVPTLNAMIDILDASTRAGGPVPTTVAAPAEPSGNGQPGHVERFPVRAVPDPLSGTSAGLNPKGVAVILDDLRGVADRVAAALKDAGWRSLRLSWDGMSPANASRYTTRRLDALKDEGTATALIDLSAISASEGDRSTDEQIRWFFEVAKELRSDLVASAEQGGAVVLAAMSLDGSLGCTGDFADATQAWRAGFLKSLAREWEPVRAKVVDFGSTDAKAVADQVLAELFSGDGVVEVGYGPDGVRRTCRLRREPFAPETGVVLDPASVVLVTGGARGITAESALALALDQGCRLVLVGRTPAPAGPEAPATAGLEDEREIKKALFNALSSEGQSPKPVEIQALYSGLLREREVRTSLERFASNGVSFTYLTCDVQDAEAFGALVDRVYEQFGRIDGVIHGAGVIEDRLIADKSLDSFLRVFHTKVTSALVLAGKLRPQSLKFFVMFSSVSGRFGNRGQADYASANEVLNKLAHKLDRTWPGRVVAINWGPWHSTGMVTEEAKRQFAAQGVGRIPVVEGARRMIHEVTAAKGQPAEVVIADLGKNADRYLAPEAEPALPFDPQVVAPMGTPDLPLLEGVAMESAEAGLRVYRTFDPDHDRYLADHVLDGKPVVPFAVGMELMAEVARAGWPDMDILEIRDIRMLNGIVIDGAPRPVVVEARPLASNNSGTFQVAVTIRSGQRLCYSSVVDMGTPNMQETPPKLANGHFKPLEAAEPLPWGIRRAYDEWLFHGPIFEAIESIDRIGPLGATGNLRLSDPKACLAGSPAGSWVTDPVLIDAAFQMQVLWVRKHWNMTILPSTVASWRPAPGVDLAALAGNTVICELRIRPESRQPISHTDFAFYAPNGQLAALINDLQATGSRALNRLSSSRTK
jgi:acyl transferase domain-containing protein/NAD(P)H-dependent flavin oxidoreductase YrpB (nitropropane dioxygenase family)/NAD(P)-dependent dehydrogenase (short-subunit alcohol dehydrogenase family)/acyl carrier protein